MRTGKEGDPVKLRHYWLLPALVLIAACGREERSEAVRFAKLLNQKQIDFGKVNTVEKEFVDGVRSWVEPIMSGGAGRGGELDRHASIARDLANSCAGLSEQLGAVRKAVENEALKSEYPRGIRMTLIDRLIKRQRSIQEIRSVLQETAPAFLQYREVRDYAGDTYPAGIGKLNQIVQSYKPPEDALAQALKELKTKYGLSDADLGS